MTTPLHPQASRLLLAARFVLVAWFSLALFAIQIGLSLFFTPDELWLLHPNVFAMLLIFQLTVAIGYICAAMGVKCSTCGRRMFFEDLAPKHVSAPRIWSMDHWASTVIEILRFGRCSCMYCGSKFVVRYL